MTYCPSDNGKARKISFIFMVVAILLWMTTSIEYRFRALVQIVSIVLIVIGLQLLTRYGLSMFRYVLERDDNGGTDFMIFKKQGSRDAKVCHVALSKVEALFKLTDDPKFEEKYGKTANRFNYCQNIGKDCQWVMLFRDGESLIEVRFEPDEKMVGAIKARIGAEFENGRSFAM